MAIAAMLFGIIAQEEIGALLNWPFLIAFGGVLLTVYLLILLGAFFWRQNDPGTATMLATLCVAANAGIIGLPLLHLLFGAKAAVLAAIANIVVVAFLLVQVVGLEAAKPRGSAKKSSTLAPIWHALLNPVVLATLLGVLCS